MVYSSRPMLSFRASRKLSSYLIKVKLYPLERVVGSCRCNGNKYQKCSNITETDKFVSSVEHRTYKINDKPNSNKKMCSLYIYLQDLLLAICWK